MAPVAMRFPASLHPVGRSAPLCSCCCWPEGPPLPWRCFGPWPSGRWSRPPLRSTHPPRCRGLCQPVRPSRPFRPSPRAPGPRLRSMLPLLRRLTPVVMRRHRHPVAGAMAAALPLPLLPTCRILRRSPPARARTAPSTTRPAPPPRPGRFRLPGWQTCRTSNRHRPLRGWPMKATGGSSWRPRPPRSPPLR